MTFDLRGQAAIVGVGSSAFARRLPDSASSLAATALRGALDDAGLHRDDVDGMITHMGTPLGVDYDQFAAYAGLNLRYAAQFWLHGRFVTLSLQTAAMAIACGMADTVACVTSVKFLSVRGALGGENDHEGLREGGGSHGEDPAFGLTSPGGGAALFAQRYMHEYGVGTEILRDVVMSSRAHAALNPAAIRREPFDWEAYANEPGFIDPLRRADCAQINDAAIVLILTSADRARDLAKSPVYVRGMQGIRGGPDEFIFAPRGFGIAQQGVTDWSAERRPRQAFEMAGVSNADIDGFGTYDAFSPLVIGALERHGYCDPGSAHRFIADGQIAPGGSLPVNTSGGLLSEAHVGGWNTIAEMVRQMRGEAGERQMPRADLMHWGTMWGDSVILGNEA
ncbi:hypothetical protein [Novosphingobium sp. PY1]|uniref:thiolase C-terminal domain-containing protein n=1 Tax=Novosphingobium sp. PY1 TaxID=1882221 RepID=UPI001A8ED480|nr:hypothetical protein [Novosphingobium sp. PY1]GFM30298.1 uncharacterized protein PY1_contig_09_30 [Novosphingobium sp. PY1]